MTVVASGEMDPRLEDPSPVEKPENRFESCEQLFSSKTVKSKEPEVLIQSTHSSHSDSDSGHGQVRTASDASCAGSRCSDNSNPNNENLEDDDENDQCFVDALTDRKASHSDDAVDGYGRSRQASWLSAALAADDGQASKRAQLVERLCETDHTDNGFVLATGSRKTIDKNLQDVNIDNDVCPPPDASKASSASSLASSLSSSDTPADGSLGERLEKTKVILSMALNNEFASALDICSRSADKELYASLANAVLSFLKVALTLEQNDLQGAVISINRSFELSSKLRKKTNMLSRFLYRANYNEDYTDEEIHAELVHAESLLLLALISFLADQSLLCLVKGAFRIRACYQHYKECLTIMEQRSEWQSDEARRHFESGVRMGHGIFNLLMSYLPRRVLRLLEYVGFSGNRSIGVDELDKSVNANDGLRSVFSALVILTYHSYVENIFGLGDYDQVKVEKLLHEQFELRYPTSAFYLLFRGRYYQMLGNLSEALDTFQQCIDSQNDWRQFHSICHWEMMWCYAVQLNWPKAAHYSDLLRKQSKWSVASYTYQYGTFLYAQLIDDSTSGLCRRDSNEFKVRLQEIRKIMQQVPKLRIRYAGKTLPAEKFAIERSLKFVQCSDGDEQLCLPALEFLYVWNIFVTLRNSPKQVEQILSHINSEIKQHESTSDQSTSSEDADDDEDEEQDSTTSAADDFNIMLLLKGMCLKHLNRFDEAKKCFSDVVENEARIKKDTFLVPHCAMELALLNLIEKKFDDSKQWIKMARNNYTGYLLETIVHFRLHAASRLIRLEQENGVEQQRQCSFDSSFDGRS